MYHLTGRKKSDIYICIAQTDVAVLESTHTHLDV